MAKKMNTVSAFFFKDKYNMISKRWKNSLAEVLFLIGVGAATLFFILEVFFPH